MILNIHCNSPRGFVSFGYEGIDYDSFEYTLILFHFQIPSNFEARLEIRGYQGWPSIPAQCTTHIHSLDSKLLIMRDFSTTDTFCTFTNCLWHSIRTFCETSLSITTRSPCINRSNTPSVTLRTRFFI